MNKADKWRALERWITEQGQPRATTYQIVDDAMMVIVSGEIIGRLRFEGSEVRYEAVEDHETS